MGAAYNFGCPSAGASTAIVPFTFHANIPAGNGVSLLANSVLTFANGTRSVNGNMAAPWLTELTINLGANGAIISHVFAANAAKAANMTFGNGAAHAANTTLIISPLEMQLQGNGTIDAANVFLAVASAGANITGKAF